MSDITLNLFASIPESLHTQTRVGEKETEIRHLNKQTARGSFSSDPLACDL